jgi:hypothetical protein
MIGLNGCPACPVVQSYTWVIFLLLLLISWERAMAKLIDRMNDETESAAFGEDPIRRTFLVALAVYAVVVVWFKMIVLMILGYVGCSLVAMTAHYAISVYIERALVWMSNPAYIFDSVSTSHIPFHAVVGGGVVMYSTIAILMYIRNEDLSNKNVIRAKMLRILMCMPCFMFAVYVVYAFYSFVMAV